MLRAAPEADVVVMAAAVADFRPVHVAESKVKKDSNALPVIALESTDDVLSLLVAERRPGQLIVGFAAETGDANADWLEHGRTKLQRKRCDVLVVNEVGAEKGFESEDNAAVILSRSGSDVVVPFGPKDDLAHTLLEVVETQLRDEAAH